MWSSREQNGLHYLGLWCSLHSLDGSYCQKTPQLYVAYHTGVHPESPLYVLPTPVATVQSCPARSTLRLIDAKPQRQTQTDHNMYTDSWIHAVKY